MASALWLKQPLRDLDDLKHDHLASLLAISRDEAMAASQRLRAFCAENARLHGDGWLGDEQLRAIRRLTHLRHEPDTIILEMVKAGLLSADRKGAWIVDWRDFFSCEQLIRWAPEHRRVQREQDRKEAAKQRRQARRLARKAALGELTCRESAILAATSHKKFAQPRKSPILSTTVENKSRGDWSRRCLRTSCGKFLKESANRPSERRPIREHSPDQLSIVVDRNGDSGHFSEGLSRISSSPSERSRAGSRRHEDRGRPRPGTPCQGTQAGAREGRVIPFPHSLGGDGPPRPSPTPPRSSSPSASTSDLGALPTIYYSENTNARAREAADWQAEPEKRDDEPMPAYRRRDPWEHAPRLTVPQPPVASSNRPGETAEPPAEEGYWEALLGSTGERTLQPQRWAPYRPPRRPEPPAQAPPAPQEVVRPETSLPTQDVCPDFETFAAEHGTLAAIGMWVQRMRAAPDPHEVAVQARRQRLTDAQLERARMAARALAAEEERAARGVVPPTEDAPPRPTEVEPMLTGEEVEASGLELEAYPPRAPMQQDPA